MKTKRITCALLCLTLVFALVPATALADEPTGVWVGGKNVEEGTYYRNDDSGSITNVNASAGNYNVYYYVDNDGKDILSLQNANITTNLALTASNLTAAVYTDRTLTIKLIGSNTLNDAHRAENSLQQSYGVYGVNDLSIEGDGSLTVRGGEGDAISAGILGSSVTIAGGTVKAASGNATFCFGVQGDSVTIEGGTLEATGSAPSLGDGLRVGVYGLNSVTIEDGLVTATGGDAESALSYGVYSGAIIMKGGTLTANGGETENGESGGLGATAITIEGGKLTATGGAVESGNSYGAFGGSVSIEDGVISVNSGDVKDGKTFGVYGDSSVSILDGKLTAHSGDAAAGSSFGVFSDSSVSIEGGTHTATGGSAGGANRLSSGVYGLSGFSMTGGTLKAVGGEAKDVAGGYSNGIYGGNVSITDGRVETGAGDVINGQSNGIYGANSVSITRSTVETASASATGSMPSLCFGVYGIEVTIEDSDVTATTGSVKSGTSCGVYGGNFVDILDSTVSASGGKAGDGKSYGLFGYVNLSVAGESLINATGDTAGVTAKHTALTGGTLNAHGNTIALSGVEGSLTDRLVVGPADTDSAFLCRSSDDPKETAWNTIAPFEIVTGSPRTYDQATDEPFNKRSVRISAASAVSGVVQDAAIAVDGFTLYVDGVRAENAVSSPVGAYSVFVDNGAHTISAEKDTQIGSVRVTLDNAALTGRDITLDNAPAPEITISSGAAFPEGGAPDHLSISVGETGHPPDSARHFGSLEISGDNGSFSTVSNKNYALRYGSLHIELSQSWLNSLTPGTYTLRVNLAGVFAGTSLTTRLVVSTVPKTGDGSAPLLWFGLMLLAVAGLAVSGSIKRRAAKRR